MDKQIIRIGLDFMFPVDLTEEEIEDLKIDVLEIMQERYRFCFGVVHEDITNEYSPEEKESIEQDFL